MYHWVHKLFSWSCFSGGEVLESTKAVLRFGGGCQGCGMVDLTLRDGVEKTLRNNIPELTEIIDSTDHSQTENAYYK